MKSGELFLVEEFLHLLRPLFVGSLLQQFLLLRCALVAHLCLQVLNLLLQEVVALLLVNVIARLVADVQFQILQVYFTMNDAQRTEQTLLDAVQLQQGHFLLYAKGEVRTDEVQCHHIVSYILDGERCLFRNVVTHVDVFCSLIAKILHGSLKLHIVLVGLLFRGGNNMTYHVGLVFQDLHQAQTAQTLYNGCNVTIGQR